MTAKRNKVICAMKLIHILAILGLSKTIIAGTCTEYSITKTVDSSFHEAYRFQREILGSLIECASYCLRGAKCKALAYTAAKECNLFTKSREDDPSLVKSEAGTYYVSKTDLPTAIAGACSASSCGIEDLCIQKELAYHCIPIYQGKRCTEPPSVANAVVDFTDPGSYQWSTGETVKYNCTSNLAASGGPSVMTCMDVGQWSYSFSC